MLVSWQSLYEQINGCTQCGLCKMIHNKVPDENMQLYFTEDPFLEPVTAGGIITRMLFERYEKRLPGMYLLTCVPVRQNSLHLKETVISFLSWLVRFISVTEKSLNRLNK